MTKVWNRPQSRSLILSVYAEVQQSGPPVGAVMHPYYMRINIYIYVYIYTTNIMYILYMYIYIIYVYIIYVYIIYVNIYRASDLQTLQKQ